MLLADIIVGRDYAVGGGAWKARCRVLRIEPVKIGRHGKVERQCRIAEVGRDGKLGPERVVRSSEVHALWAVYRRERAAQIERDAAVVDEGVKPAAAALDAALQRVPGLGRVNAYTTQYHVGMQLSPAQARRFAAWIEATDTEALAS